MTDPTADAVAARGRASAPTHHDATAVGGASLVTASPVRNALADGLEPGTPVFAISDVVAIGALSAPRDAGREVGSDIAFREFDDITTARDATPALTTVPVPLEDVGYQTLRAAVDQTWEQDADSIRLDVMLRESTPGR